MDVYAICNCVPRWELIKERFIKKKKENTLTTKKKGIRFKKKERKQDHDHAIDQEKYKF